MGSKIELIARHARGGELQTTLCRNGESLAAKAQTLYEMKLDGDTIPSGTCITRQEDELHFKFPDRATFDITDWNNAHGSSFVVVSGAMAFEDVAGKFVTMHSLKGGTFSIFSKAGAFLGLLGSSNSSNFLALTAILARLRLPRTPSGLPCIEHGDGLNRMSVIATRAEPERLSRVGNSIHDLSFSKPAIKERAIRCTCNFAGAININS